MGFARVCGCLRREFILAKRSLSRGGFVLDVPSAQQYIDDGNSDRRLQLHGQRTSQAVINMRGSGAGWQILELNCQFRKRRIVGALTKTWT